MSSSDEWSVVSLPPIWLTSTLARTQAPAKPLPQSTLSSLSSPSAGPSVKDADRSGSRLATPSGSSAESAEASPLYRDAILSSASIYLRVGRLRDMPSKILDVSGGDGKVRLIGSHALSVAMNNSEARLYISWMDDSTYSTQKVRSCLMDRAEDYILFRRTVRNIIDWGRDERLAAIQEALYDLLEHNRQHASARAKAHAPPSDSGGSASSTASGYELLVT